MRSPGRAAAVIGLLSVLSLLSFNTADATLTFVQDGDFQDWQSLVLGSGSGDVTRVSTGGNPGAYLVMGSSNHSTNDICVWVLAYKPDFVWDPASDGPICTVEMAIDEKAISSFGEGQNVKLLVVQDGRYYGATLHPWFTGGGIDTTWETLHIGPATASNFFEATEACWDTTSTPDFSATGAPIQFGFMVGNTNTVTRVTHAYDNWCIWIDMGPSSTDASSWGGVKNLWNTR